MGENTQTHTRTLQLINLTGQETMIVPPETNVLVFLQQKLIYIRGRLNEICVGQIGLNKLKEQIPYTRYQSGVRPISPLWANIL